MTDHDPERSGGPERDGTPRPMPAPPERAARPAGNGTALPGADSAGTHQAGPLVQGQPVQPPPDAVTAWNAAHPAPAVLTQGQVDAAYAWADQFMAGHMRPGGWQGASGPMPLSGAAAAAEGARAAALDLNGRIRRPDGEWLDGPDVVEELGEWLREHGIDDRGPAEAEAGGPLDLTPPPRAAQLSDFVFVHMDPEHAGDLDLTHATCRLALGTLECQDDLGSLAEAAIRHLGICPGPGSPDDEDGRWTDFDGAFTQLAAGPAWAPGISDKDVIVRLMGDAQDSGGPASYEDMALIECRKGRWRVTWRDRPLQGSLPAGVAVQALHAQRHQLSPDVLRSLAEIWVCGSAARYGEPAETWWWDDRLFRTHDTAGCEAEDQPDPEGDVLEADWPVMPPGAQT